MKKTFALPAALLLAATFATAAPLPCDTVAGDPTHTRIYTLQNGLKVYLSVNKDKPRIQTYIAVRTGSKNDPAETTGLAHYLEHLMFKGTRQFGVTDPDKEQPWLDEIERRYEEYRLLTDTLARKRKYHEIDSLSQQAAQYFIPNEYDKLMATIGAEGTNAYTSNDVTCYTEDIPANQVDAWAKIQADRMMNMVIRGFHTELEAVYEEYNIHLSSDVDKMYNALYAKLFPTHPYGTQTTIGTQQHLKNPSITNIKRYFDHWYRPNNVAICMAGDLDPDAVVAILQRHFGSWQPGKDVNQPTFAPLPPQQQPTDTTVVGQEEEQVMLAWRYGRGASLEADTMSVLSDMLSNGQAGLLDLNLNSQMRLLGSYCFNDDMQDHSALILGGTPKEGQTLDEVRQLLLEQVGKLKSGDFSDDLLPSIINNTKWGYYTSLESNAWRANQQVQAFVNGKPWQQQATYLERIKGITKQQIVSFARRHLGEGVVTIYKRQGEDTTQKPVDKPAITAIPTNRDLVSRFVEDIQQAKVEPIHPHFVDFSRDLTQGETRRRLPITAVTDPESGRFSLRFQYDFGSEADLRYHYLSDYMDYLGTSRMTQEQLKQRFYLLACNMYMAVDGRTLYVQLNGLAENMVEGLKLMEQVLNDAKATDESWQQYIQLLDKARKDSKTNQGANFNALYNYGVYGARNPYNDILSTEQLANTKPEELMQLLRGLSQYKHHVYYYGPLTTVQLDKVLSKWHKTAKRLADGPQNRHYQAEATTQNEVVMAPYDAKNIYMRMLHNEQRPWHQDELGLQALYNEYFGGGMNGVVFQELREARGLAYNAWAYYSQPNHKDQRESFMTHIITQNDKMMDCVRQFQQILDTLPQSQAAFRIAKEALTKRLASERTMRWGLISKWMDAQEMGIDYDKSQRIYEQLQTLTLQDLVDFAKRQVAHKPYRYVILGDEKQLDMESLQKIGPIRRLTTEEIFGY